jgi:elongation factor Ts
MNITASMVKDLRQKTGAGVMACKEALVAVEGDMDKAVLYLREKGTAVAARKLGRAVPEGIVTSYIHYGNRIGVLLELNCETDFVARTEEFQQLARDIAMQIAAKRDSLYIKKEDVPESEVESERSILKAQALNEGLLFSAERKPEEYRIDLDSEKIPRGLRQEFEDNKISLSQNSTVSVKDKGSNWLITDKGGNKKKTYFVREAEDKLKIYSQWKPEGVVDKIVEGRLQKFFSNVCLMEQEFIKDSDKTIGDLVLEKISTIGENITIRRFTRYELGEE